mmetsp:Transcript_844/g.2261  ORF Transcript_844/g.2261 Transcript_844/m.2261 type:complete len:109 (-) Transcript_844:209-535(-)|eukprot:361562-Chlamydomonas_euryale.AAC.2
MSSSAPWHTFACREQAPACRAVHQLSWAAVLAGAWLDCPWRPCLRVGGLPMAAMLTVGRAAHGGRTVVVGLPMEAALAGGWTGSCVVNGTDVNSGRLYGGHCFVAAAN